LLGTVRNVMGDGEARPRAWSAWSALNAAPCRQRSLSKSACRARLSKQSASLAGFSCLLCPAPLSLSFICPSSCHDRNQPHQSRSLPRHSHTVSFPFAPHHCQSRFSRDKITIGSILEYVRSHYTAVAATHCATQYACCTTVTVTPQP